MNTTFTRIFRNGAVLTAGLFLGAQAFAQTSVSMTTTNTDLGGGQYSVKQFGTGNPTDDIQFTFNRLDSVVGHEIDINDVLAINVTFRFVVDGIELTATNNTGSQQTYTSDDVAELFPRFSGDDRLWTMDNVTSDTTSAGASIAAADFDFLTELQLDGVTLDPGQTTNVTDDKDITETRNVHSQWWGGYDGTGAYNFRVNSDFFAGAAIGSSGFATSQQVEDSSWFAEVEYIVIPEPGTLALAAIAFGGMGCLALVRRKR